MPATRNIGRRHRYARDRQNVITWLTQPLRRLTSWRGILLYYTTRVDARFNAEPPLARGETQLVVHAVSADDPGLELPGRRL